MENVSKLIDKLRLGDHLSDDEVRVLGKRYRQAYEALGGMGDIFYTAHHEAIYRYYELRRYAVAYDCDL